MDTKYGKSVTFRVIMYLKFMKLVMSRNRTIIPLNTGFKTFLDRVLTINKIQ